jgi:hypothetical protein
LQDSSWPKAFGWSLRAAYSDLWRPRALVGYSDRFVWSSTHGVTAYILAVLLVIVGLLASLVPARRAAQIDAMATIREW